MIFLITTMIISLNEVKDIRKFISLISNLTCDVYLKQNEYIVNAKSIMGLFSLDLTKPITVVFEEDKETSSISEEVKEFLDELKWILKEKKNEKNRKI